MQVLHILWSGRIGGKERAVYQLVRSQLDHSNLRPAVAFGQFDGHYADMIRNLGCQVVDLAMRNGHDLMRLTSIRRALQRFPVHHFHSAELAIMLGSIACRRVRRIYTHRGGMHQYGLRKRLVYGCVGFLLRTAFHGLSANTRHGVDAAARVTGIPRARWTITYNGMDFDLLQPTKDPATVAQEHGVNRPRKVIIGTTAHLRPWKRMERLLTACAELRPDSFQLLIVGDGPDRSRLEVLSQKLGIQDTTIFAGMQKQIADYLALMDIFVLPSGPGESFGNSLIEAMAMGLPALVFADGGGLVEHIDHGRTGFVVNSREDLSKKLERLVKDPVLRRTQGQAAANYVREKYTLENMLVRYDDLYRSALPVAT